MDGLIIKRAKASDATTIAEMSRALIEEGLGWSWRPARVTRQLARSDTLGVVVREDRRVVAFAIASYGDLQAHLLLLAVAPSHRRRGLGRRLIDWHEACARAAGIESVHLEVREGNQGAQRFYKTLGFVERGRTPGYYSGREGAVKMVHTLTVRALR